MARVGDNKERLEEAAVALFAEKGVAGAGVAEIAARAGVSQGFLYRHWTDKEEMALDLFSRRYLAMRERLERAIAGESTTKAQLAAMFREGCRIHDEDAATFRFLLATQHQHLGRRSAETPTIVNVVRGVIRSGIARGEIGLQDETTATAVVLGIFLQAAIFDLYGDLRRPLGEAAGTLSEACWRALAGREH